MISRHRQSFSDLTTRLLPLAILLALVAALAGPAMPARAEVVANEMAGMKSGSVASIKRLLGGGDVSAALERERMAFVAQILTPEAREGMWAFLGEG